MAETASLSSITTTPTQQPKHHLKLWLAIALLSLALHTLFLSSPTTWLESGAIPLPPRVDVKQMDQKQLDRIRRQWEREAPHLLSKDTPTKEQTETPDNARYISDRNRRVEREQQAREGDVLPKTPKGQDKAKTQNHRVPKLGTLGIPMDLSTPGPQGSKTARYEGAEAEQLLKDPNVPQGTENLLNTAQSVYYSYYARIRETIGPSWQSLARERVRSGTARPGVYTTSVEVIMDREGWIKHVVFLERSTDPTMDEIVEQAWLQAKRFQNPPAGMLQEDGNVHTQWQFEFTVAEGSLLHFTSPHRLE